MLLSFAVLQQMEHKTMKLKRTLNSLTTQLPKDRYPVECDFSLAIWLVVLLNCRHSHTASFYQYGMMITWIAGMGREIFVGWKWDEMGWGKSTGTGWGWERFMGLRWGQFFYHVTLYRVTLVSVICESSCRHTDRSSYGSDMCAFILLEYDVDECQQLRVLASLQHID